MDDRSPLIDEVPVPEGGARRAIADGNRRHRVRLTAATLGCGVLIVALVLGALTLRPGSEASVTTAASVPGTAAPERLLGGPLLDLPPAALAATPTIPAGWRTIHHGLASVSVPDTLLPVTPHSPGTCPPPTVVLSVGTVDAASSTVLCTVSSSTMVVSSYTTPCTDCGEPQIINGLRVDAPGSAQCMGCGVRIELPELKVRIDMPNNVEWREQVLSTITLSPVARALAEGPTADVASWRTETEQQVTLRVPAGWPDATVAQNNAFVASCGRNPLHDHPGTVLRGQGRGRTDCAFDPPGVEPIDGVWLWTRAKDDPWMSDQAYDTEAMVDAIDLGGGRVLVPRFHDPDRVYVVVDGPAGRTIVAVAINADPTIARTVLRSITVDGHHLSEGAPSSSPRTTTTATAGPGTTMTTVPGPTSVTPTVAPDTTTSTPSSTTTAAPPSTSTTTTPSSSAPRPTRRDLRADLVEVGAAVDTAPPALWDLSRDIPSCSISDRDDLYEGPTTGSLPEAQCLFGALERHEPASIVELAYSVEGDPIVFVTILRPDGSFEGFTDSSRDAFGSGGWSRQTCAGPVQPDPPALRERQLISGIIFSDPACATP